MGRFPLDKGRLRGL